MRSAAGAAPDGLHQRVLRGLALVVWAVELLAIVLPGLPLANGAAAALVLLLIAGARALEPLTVAYCALLGSLCAGSLVFGGAFADVAEGLRQASLIAAFLLTLQFMRATVEAHPGLPEMRRRFTALPRRERGGGVLMTTHLLGTVLTIGSLAVIAPLVREAAPDDRKRIAELGMRGLSMVVVWSPFTVATAIVSAYAPDMPFWRVAAGGLTVVVIAFAASVVLGEARLSPATIRQVLAIVGPVFWPLMTGAGLVMLGTTVLGLSALQATVTIMLLFCLSWCLVMGRGTLRRVSIATSRSMTRILDDLTLFTFALVLASVLTHSPSFRASVEGLIGTGTPSYASFVGGTLLTAFVPMLGIHMIVPGALVFALLLPGLDHDVFSQWLLIVMVLVGWTFGSMLSMASLALMTASTLFQLPRVGLMFGRNFGFLSGLLGGTCLLGWALHALFAN
ncbi:hypothetical protein [Marinivivus vitaminiproducens]|uniref:hypothetical protein n=1 Tax=Marinivivus vitaminiproducens TaxID=3035935 RepID=UPI00279965FA|nr:hypothetical protein P4R82_06535 [Geminicoccaceae bacterium SCSIO 64248]